MAAPVPFEEWRKYVEPLRDRGIEPVLVTSPADLESADPLGSSTVALILVGNMPRHSLRACLKGCEERRLPSIALVNADHRDWSPELMEVDDFILGPLRAEELALRATRLIERKESPEDEDVVRAGDLLINKANFEVSIGGRRVSLRYKEYELLLLMASNPGRVFSREALLNRIWGYDYLGGTRTVDVHIRRLRSKIEDAEHTFIETVWQVGYRFRPLDR